MFILGGPRGPFIHPGPFKGCFRGLGLKILGLGFRVLGVLFRKNNDLNLNRDVPTLLNPSCGGF